MSSSTFGFLLIKYEYLLLVNRNGNKENWENIFIWIIGATKKCTYRCIAHIIDIKTFVRKFIHEIQAHTCTAHSIHARITHCTHINYFDCIVTGECINSILFDDFVFMNKPFTYILYSYICIVWIRTLNEILILSMISFN